MTRVTLEISRGYAAIPGLCRTLTVHLASLPVDARQRLEALVTDPALFDGVPTLAAVRDARTYVLTVDDGREQRALRFSDPVSDAGLRELRDLVSSHGTPGRAP